MGTSSGCAPMARPAIRGRRAPSLQVRICQPSLPAHGAGPRDPESGARSGEQIKALNNKFASFIDKVGAGASTGPCLGDQCTCRGLTLPCHWREEQAALVMLSELPCLLCKMGTRKALTP